jgi:hypothetical protein
MLIPIVVGAMAVIALRSPSRYYTYRDRECDTEVYYNDGHTHQLWIPRQRLYDAYSSGYGYSTSMSVVNNHSHGVHLGLTEAARVLNGEVLYFRSWVGGSHPHTHTFVVGCR